MRSLDPHHAEPIRLAVKAALLARSRDPRKLHRGFAAVRDCPVMHVATYDHLADPRDEAALHRDHLDIAGDSLPPAPRVRPPPPSKPPPKLALSTDAPLLPRPVDARDKVMLTLVLPARVRDELGSFAVGADKPVSWIVQQAILLVRHRLLAAATR